MYILIVARGDGKDAIFEYDQAKALANAGHKIVYIAINWRDKSILYNWGIKHFKEFGFDVYSVNIHFMKHPFVVLNFFGKLWLKILYKIVEKRHGTPNIIHAHFTDVASFVIPLMKNDNKKFVMTEHSSQVNMEVCDIRKNTLDLARKVYSKYDRIIAVSPALADKIFKISGMRATYIPNIVDLDIFQRTKQIREGSFKFIFVGNMISGKNPQMCISAFAKAFVDNDNVTLTLIGGGNKLSECKQLVKTLNIDKKVNFTGKISRTEIAQYLNRADCFVLPSQGETFGVAYIEAMACGLPVIATCCGGPESFVNENNGVLIPINDEQALVGAFKFMLKSAKSYDSQKIAEETRLQFAPQKIAAELTKLYRGMLR